MWGTPRMDTKPVSFFFVTKFQSTERDGGRDGLGLLPLWSNLARRSIWNVTTVSSDLAGWRSLLLAVWMADLLAPADRGSRERALFAAERLIALARWHAPNRTAQSRAGVRGGTRVAQANGAVHVGGLTPHTFLRAQESSGIVGQIGRPAIRSGLLTEDLHLSKRSRDAADRWYCALRDERATLRRWVIDGAHVNLDSDLLSAIEGAVCRWPAQEEADWWFAQVACARDATDPTGSWQPGLQRCIAEHLRTLTPPKDPGALVHRLRAALARSADPDASAVTAWLDKLVHVEAILGPMAALFDWLRTRLAEPTTPDEAVRGLDHAWFQPLAGATSWIEVVAPHVAAHQDEALRALELPDDARGEFFRFTDAVTRRDADATVRAVVARNAAVTGRRGQKEPWILAHAGHWLTMFHGDRPALLHPQTWEHGYYLPQLATFANACGEASS